jgi:hypothetical protein
MRVYMTLFWGTVFESLLRICNLSLAECCNWLECLACNVPGHIFRWFPVKFSSRWLFWWEFLVSRRKRVQNSAAQRLKKERRYTSSPPLCLHSMFEGELYTSAVSWKKLPADVSSHTSFLFVSTCRIMRHYETSWNWLWLIYLNCNVLSWRVVKIT